MHLGMHALRASDHAICGLTMIFACISDSLFSDWFPINSDSLWGIAADLVTVCHWLSLSVTAFSDNAQDLSIVFCLLSRFVTVRHGLSRNMLGNLKPIWTFSDNMQSPTFTFRQCVRYLRSSEMTSLFACISDLTLFTRMDPQGTFGAPRYGTGG